MSPELYELRKKTANLMPPTERDAELRAIEREKLTSEIEDGRWSEWYEQYHRVVLRQEPELLMRVRRDINRHLEVSGLYLLVSAVWVPGVRHWWCLLPASVWLLLLVADEFWGWKRSTDRWLTLNDQISFLSKKSHVAD